MRILNLMVICFIMLACSDKNKDQEANGEQSSSSVASVSAIKLQDAVSHNIVGHNVSNDDSAIMVAEQNQKNNPEMMQYDIGVINSRDIVWGNLDAKVVLIEYSSPTCPYCANYRDKTFKKIKEKYIDTNKIAYVLRLYIASQPDLYASTLVMCNPEKSKAFVETLYARQQSWAFNHNYQEILTNIGQLGGVNAKEYQKCLNDSNLSNALLVQTRSLDQKPNFAGIPALLINGELSSKSHSFEDVSSQIDQILNS